jgi:sarcosine oxidase subunit beta
MPMTIWVDDGFHARVRDGRVLALMPTPGDPDDPTSTRVDPMWVASVTLIARERIPVLRDADFERGTAWAGLYEMSPDGHALLGAAPGCANLILANGSSGHGVMHAPALGLLVAEILSDGRASSMDTTELDPGRFVGGTVERRELL